MSGIIYQETRTPLDDGDASAPYGTPYRATLVSVETPDGDSAMDEVNDALRVNVVAGGGGGGGGTSMTDDAAFTPGTTAVTPAAGFYASARDSVNDGDAGALAMTPVRGLLAALETPTGDSVMDDTNDAVRVNIVAGAGSGGTAATDESAFTEGTTSFTPIGGVFNDSFASDPASGEAAAARITSDRALHTNLRNASGTELGVLAAPLRVDPTGTTNQPVVGTKSNNGGAPGSTSLGTLPAVATAAAPSYSEGNQVGLSLDLAGAARVAGTVTANGGTGPFPVAGMAAHDAAVSGNPVLVGAEARKTLGTAVAAGDAVRVAADPYGRLYTTDPVFSQASSNASAITTATDTTAVAAPSAGNHLKVWRIHAVNSGATATFVYWRSSASGTRRYPMYLPQNAITSLKLDGGWHLSSAEALVITTSAGGCNVEWHVDYETVVD